MIIVETSAQVDRRRRWYREGRLRAGQEFFVLMDRAVTTVFFNTRDTSGMGTAIPRAR
jgi:hypothetical protein